jgi:hypothetical protein
MEGKDGNPLKEVRVLCTSLMENDGVLAADKQIRLRPETSILHLAVGDEIRLTQGEFLRLAEASSPRSRRSTCRRRLPRARSACRGARRRYPA